MKIAFIKQQIDIFGPWKSISYGNTTDLFNVWPGKASYFEFTLLTKADWYVIDQCINTEYTNDLLTRIPDFKKVILDYSETIPLKNIPFDNYDIVICFDPIPSLPKLNKTVKAYFIQEHWDNNYPNSLIKPLFNFDLFLAHNTLELPKLSKLPSSISMPYPRCPNILRNLYSSPKEDFLWLDWRSITSPYEIYTWENKAQEALEIFLSNINYQCYCNVNFGKTPFGFSNPPNWGNINDYYKKLSTAKYYISIGRKSGPGQGLVDAASLGCICIGGDRSSHFLICHPMCLCENLSNGITIFNKIKNSSNLQQEILTYQDKQLKSIFVDYPQTILNRAYTLKCQ